jgi:hypothetical protein
MKNAVWKCGKVLIYTVPAVFLGLYLGMSWGVAEVSVGVVPSGSTTGGAGVLKPSYDFGPKTEAEVSDGDPFDPGPAKLHFQNTDSAMAEDTSTYQITIQGVGGSAETLIDVHLIATGSVTALTEHAPGSPSGTYLTDASAWFSANLAGGTFVDGGEVVETIATGDSGSITTHANWTFADAVDPVVPYTISHTGQGSIVFEYTVGVGVALQAQRPEVTVGGGGVSHVIVGEIAAWDYSDPLNPVIAKQPDNSDAIWYLE